MKKIVILVSLIVSVSAQTNVSGTISGNTTWNLAGSPYSVTANINIAIGATLIISPGVTVKVTPGLNFVIQGKLIAKGTSNDSIIFTSTDGSNWDGLAIPAGYEDTTTISHSRIEYSKPFAWFASGANGFFRISKSEIHSVDKIITVQSGNYTNTKITIDSSYIHDSISPLAFQLVKTISVFDNIITKNSGSILYNWPSGNSSFIERNVFANNDAQYIIQLDDVYGSTKIIDNIFINNNAYMVISHSRPRESIYHYNYFENNIPTYSLYYSWITGQPNDSLLKYNSFLNNTGNIIRNSEATWTGTIYAGSNWWNTTDSIYVKNNYIYDFEDDFTLNKIYVTPLLDTPDLRTSPIIPQNLQTTGTGNDFINVSWDSSPIADLSGYKLYYDTDFAGYPYSNSIDIGNSTSYSLTSLSVGKKYYVAVTTYDTDGNESWYSKEVTVQLNQTPVLSNISNITLNEDGIELIKLSATDADGDAITYSGFADTTAITVSTSDDTLKLTPQANWHGSSVITVYVSDGSLNDTTSFTLTVTPVNDAPVLEDIADVTINEEAAAEVKISATDVEGDAITYSASTDTSAVVATVSNDTLKLVPTANWNGESNISVFASDGSLIDTTNFKLIVSPINDAPVISAIDAVTMLEDAYAIIGVSATDLDADNLTFTAASDTSAVTTTISTDSLKITLESNWHGSSVITVYVSDGSLNDTTSFTLTVTPVNDAPTLRDTLLNEDASIIIAYSLQEGVSLSSKADTSAISLSISNNTLSITPTADWNGISIIRLIASASNSVLDSTSFVLTVKPVQDKPYVFDWVSTVSDSINITQTNLTDTYELKWTKSKEVDGEVVDYHIYAQIGQMEVEMIHDTTDTSYAIPYRDFINNVFEDFAMLSRATVRFSVYATDGIDSVKVTGDDRVVFVNRHEFLSTENDAIPTEYSLHQNFPNPFNPITTIRFDLPEAGDVSIVVYNMLGQRVRTFDYRNLAPGFHSLKWDATNDIGRSVGAGVYLYQINTKNYVKTRKMVLLR